MKNFNFGKSKIVKLLNASLVIIFILFMSACNKTITYEEFNQDDMNIFIKHDSGSIGDVMPFYDNGKWNIFYLHDSPPSPGFHPWYRFSTENFYEFRDHGEVIPVVHDTADRDLALGTGSVIKKDNTYYAFYTAHNGNLSPKETIRLSVSNDNMETWTKDPSFEIDPSNPKYDFNTFDFRDPHVVFIPEKNLYYMLFTTRHMGKGAVGYLTSTDLLTWEKEGDGIFFLNNKENGTGDPSSNLECPTLVFYNGFWYLTFSDQWPTRTTHYLYTDNLDEGFIKPEYNVFDGAGLYAGKIEKGNDQLLLMGWVSSDFNRTHEFAWAGSFIAHELVQSTDGSLHVELIDSIDSELNSRRPLDVLESNVTLEDDKYTFEGDGLKYLIFDELEGINKITGKLNISSFNNDFGIMFDYFDSNSSYFYDFNKDDSYISFNRGSFLTEDTHEYTRNKINLNRTAIEFTILFEDTNDQWGSIVTLYIGSQMAITGRMFRINEVNFGFYSKGNEITITDLKLFK